MSTFHELLNSLKNAEQARELRLSLIRNIEKETSRPLVVYAAAIAGKHPMAPIQIDVTDKTAFSDLVDGIPGESLDVLLHSSGGSAEAVEQIVNLLRARFKELRFIVPHTATSAATLMVLAGDTVLMDDRSTLGPIDPQIIIPIPNGQIKIPAHSYVQGFERAQKAIEQQSEIAPAYLPLLNKYEMYLLEVCDNAVNLSVSLAKEWLRTYMLKDNPNADKLASEIASELSDLSKFLSHQRPIGIKKAKEIGLNVTDMAELPKLRELVWDLYCTIELHFGKSDAVKLFENSRGVSYQRNFVVQQVGIHLPIAPVPSQPSLPAVPPQE